MFLLLVFFITNVFCLTSFNHTWFFETENKEDFILDIDLYKYHKIPNQFRCINGDACHTNIIQLFCVARPHLSLFELKCEYYGMGMKMKNLEVQCIYDESHFTSRQCVATYDLWKTTNFPFLDDFVSSLWGKNHNGKESAKGVMMGIDYAYEHDHFNKTTWKEIYDNLEIKPAKLEFREYI